MQNLLNDLIVIFKKDDRLVANGEVRKNKIQELALSNDEKLISSLLSNSTTKESFFIKVGNALVFDKDKFIRFVSNKEFLPDSYTSFKNKIGLTEGDEFISLKKEVVLSWPHKDCVLEGGQTKEDAKRKEIFWNEILAPDDISRLLEPKVLTSIKRIDKNGEKPAKEIKDTDNLIIKGNNLLALHSLKERFKGKIKLIYIDPPYNTGTEDDTFAYNNTFKHSTWLTFMKNRLEIAREMLKEDGFIAISIDHVELYYLGAVADEIYSRENRVGLVTILHNPKGRNQSKFFSANSEFMMIYAKNINKANFRNVAISDEVKDTFELDDDEGKFRYEPYMRARTVWSRENRPNNWYPIYVSVDLKEITHEKRKGFIEVYPITNDGKEMAWKNIRESFVEQNKNGYFIAKKENNKIRIFHKYREQQVLKNVWIDKKYQSEFQGTNLLKKLMGEKVFSYPKSLYAVLDTIKIMTGEDDIILDFFAGSGTTGHAVLELNKEDGENRKFILCEQMDYVETVTKERIKKVIEIDKQGEFVYCELMKWNEIIIDDINKAKIKTDIKKIWSDIKDSGRLSYKINIKSFDVNAKDFEDLSVDDQKRFLFEVLDKNQLYVNLSDIDDKEYKVSAEDKRLNKQFYQN